MEDNNYNKKSGVYTVPVSGYYQLSATNVHIIPTGEYETVLNPNKRWYEFWKPKLITREIYKTEFREDGVQIKLLKAGETVDTTDMTWIRRIQ